MSTEEDGLGSKGIVAIVIGGLLVIVAIIVLVSLLVVLWYLCYHGNHTRRSGKYVVDNTDMDMDMDMEMDGEWELYVWSLNTWANTLLLDRPCMQIVSDKAIVNIILS